MLLLNDDTQSLDCRTETHNIRGELFDGPNQVVQRIVQFMSEIEMLVTRDQLVWYGKFAFDEYTDLDALDRCEHKIGTEQPPKVSLKQLKLDSDAGYKVEYIREPRRVSNQIENMSPDGRPKKSQLLGPPQSDKGLDLG